MEPWVEAEIQRGTKISIHPSIHLIHPFIQERWLVNYIFRFIHLEEWFISGKKCVRKNSSDFSTYRVTWLNWCTSVPSVDCRDSITHHWKTNGRNVWECERRMKKIDPVSGDKTGNWHCCTRLKQQQMCTQTGSVGGWVGGRSPLNLNVGWLYCSLAIFYLIIVKTTTKNCRCRMQSSVANFWPGSCVSQHAQGQESNKERWVCKCVQLLTEYSFLILNAANSLI